MTLSIVAVKREQTLLVTHCGTLLLTLELCRLAAVCLGGWFRGKCALFWLSPLSLADSLGSCSEAGNWSFTRL